MRRLFALGLFILVFPLLAATDSRLMLKNLAPENGITFLQNNYATDTKYPFETLGGAVAAFDYDGDGMVDLLFLNGSPSPTHVKIQPESYNRLYRNKGSNRFVEVTEKTGLSGSGKKGYPQGVATADYDNDGDTDVYITNFGDNILYRNNGDGTFSDVTSRAGLAMSEHPFKASAAWLDYDNDGRLDLFATYYFQWSFDKKHDTWCGEKKPGYRTYCSPDVFDPLPNALFRNNGDGTFTDVSVQSGISKSLGKGMGVAIADYNRDGFIDVFVTNDKMPNFLYRNNGDGTLAEVATEAGVSANENGAMVSGMGCDFKDATNDGFPDVFYTDLVDECFTFFLNDKGRFFLDMTFPSLLGKLSRNQSGWSTKFVDLDNDGWKDIFVAGSHVVDNVNLYNPKFRYKDPCRVYRNLGNGKFEDASAQSGPDMDTLGGWRGVAAADFDNDGWVELAVSRLNDRPFFFDNIPGTANWITLKLEGTKSNRDAIGALVTVKTASGKTQFDHVTTANGIYSASDRRLHFGLGNESGPVSAEISWPGGQVQKIDGLKANTEHNIREPR